MKGVCMGEKTNDTLLDFHRAVASIYGLNFDS